MSTSDQFYLTLPSNAGESNTTANFRVQLPNPINLQGNWEVGLAEIQYPFSWNNIDQTMKGVNSWDNVLFISFKPSVMKETQVSVHIPSGHYESIHELLDAFKHEFSTKKVYPYEGGKKRGKAKPLGKYIQIDYRPMQKRIKISLNTNFIKGIILGNRLQYLFGFDVGRLGVLSSSVNYAKYPPDIFHGFSTLYVYCDLVQPQVIGNSLAPLLRTISVTDRKYGGTVNEIFLSPHYIPIRNRYFSSVAVEIKNDQNELIPFKFGKAIIKLHLRKAE